MSEPAAPEESKASKPKSKKMLIVIIAAVLLLVGAGVAGWLIMSKKAHADDGEDEPAAVAHAAPKAPPAFLPLDNMVVNLADPGGERMAQIGITIELADTKAVEKVKSFLPSIRSGILLLISQRTSAELLVREGKEKLAQDILQEVSRPLGFAVEAPAEADAHADAKPKKKKSKSKDKDKDAEVNPVQGVLFSSFIVQ